MNRCLLQFCLIALLCAQSCTPVFEPNKRILVKGEVLDQDGEGISGREVGVYTNREWENSWTYHHEDAYLLGIGETAHDGRFSVTSLADREHDIGIAIAGGEHYTDYVYANKTEDDAPSNETFDIGTVTLRNSVQVGYSISRVNSPGTSLYFTFSYQKAKCLEVFENGLLNPDLSDCYSEVTLSSLLNDNHPEVSGEFMTLAGSMVTFSYAIDGGAMTTETFTVDPQNNTYEFTY